MNRFARPATILIAATAGILALSACDPTGKAAQPYQDAKVSDVNDTPASQGTMPDGFSNFASKCDHGNRVYVLYHANSAYGALTVVPNDPTCAS